MKYVVVTTARDEEQYIERVIASLTAQTVKPQKWIIVDDGSTDRTVEIAQSAAAQYPWIQIIQRENRGYRQVGVGNYDALQEGFKALEKADYDYLCIIDADVEFKPQYFEALNKKFLSNPNLGIGCGVVWDSFEGESVAVGFLPELTFGALKCYRRECWNAIGGLIRVVCWDAVDNFKAMQLGWVSESFKDEDLKILHLRPTGSSQGDILRGRYRRGTGMHFMGAHPLWVLASALRRMIEPPLFLGAWYIFWGYLKERLNGGPQIKDYELVNFIRNWQMRKLKSLFINLGKIN